MKLKTQEVEQFNRIWWSLLAHVNIKCNISSEFNSQVESKNVLPFTARPIREKLWADNSHLESFVSENPARLSDDDLGIVASWKQRIAGKFFIYKYLVKYTVFIDDKTPPHVYGIHGISAPIEDILLSPLPVLVETVLLPFKGKIIFDSIINIYNVHFGSGYRSNLDIAYRDAKEREGIITSLIPQNLTLTTEQLQNSFLERNNIILKAFSKYLSKSGLSIKMVQQHTENIEIFADKYLLNFDPPRLLLDIDCVHLMDYFDKVLIDIKERKTNAVSFKRFIRFLTETGRLSPDDYWTINDLLKGYKE